MVELTPKQLRSIDRTLSGGTWIITAGAVLFSVLTVTPLVQRVTPAGWEWTAPILPIVVDAAVVIVIRLDAAVSRLGESAGRWPGVLRWLTGAMTLALNVGDSALKGDAVGVAVHAVAPSLLIVTAEASLAYRRAITRALDRREREQREEREREQREREQRAERERREREEREQREQAAREQHEREKREHQLQREREQREAERDRREFEAAQEREREERGRRERAEQQERERVEKEREEREAREREERERQERERQRQERKERREAGVRGGSGAGVHASPAGAGANTPATTPNDKLPEPDARAAVVSGVAEGAGVRELARRTGWSVAWVSGRVREARGIEPEQSEQERPEAAELAGVQ